MSHHGHEHQPAVPTGDLGADILQKNVADFMNDLDGGHPQDHSAHAVHNHHADHSMHMMKMWFHGGCEEVILFDFWRVDSWSGMFWSCILICLMGIFYEGIKWGRINLQMRISSTPSRRIAPLVLPALYVIQLVLAYWLMLVVMTYNTYLTTATVLGAGIGHAFFAVWKPWGFDELAQDACH